MANNNLDIGSAQSGAANNNLDIGSAQADAAAAAAEGQVITVIIIGD